MAIRLARSVIVDGETFAAGTEQTPDLSTKIPNAVAWEGGPEEIQAPPAPAEPARSGAGSGVEAWRGYARSAGVQVADDAGRDDIIAAVDAAK